MDEMQKGMEMEEGQAAPAQGESPVKKIGEMIFNLREAMLGVESALAESGNFPPEGVKALQGAIQNYTQFMGIAGQAMGIPQMAEAAAMGAPEEAPAAPQGPVAADMPMPRKGVKAVPVR